MIERLAGRMDLAVIQSILTKRMQLHATTNAAHGRQFDLNTAAATIVNAGTISGL
jgi:hypothetical protein